MCCSEQHYPKDAGIWRTDACGSHVHYSDTVVEPEGSCPGYGSEHHWHAVTPLRITACVTYTGMNIGLKVQDWFRLDRDESMGLPPARGVFDVAASITLPTVEDAERARELVLLAIAEGYDWSEEALRKLLPKAKIAWRGRANREVKRPEPPDYETWKRWNTFIRPAHNDALYNADFGSNMKYSGLDNQQIKIVDGDFDIDAWHQANTPEEIIRVQTSRSGHTSKAPPTASGWKPLQPTEDDVEAARKALLEALFNNDEEDA